MDPLRSAPAPTAWTNKSFKRHLHRATSRRSHPGLLLFVPSHMYMRLPMYYMVTLLFHSQFPSSGLDSARRLYMSLLGRADSLPRVMVGPRAGAQCTYTVAFKSIVRLDFPSGSTVCANAVSSGLLRFALRSPTARALIREQVLRLSLRESH